MTAAPVPFGARLAEAFGAYGRLCVGIDPHASLLTAWSLADSAAGALELGLRTVEACAGRVGVVKPQVAFFERFGAAGYTALEQVLQAARAAGLLVIADAKRGDIGSTFDAYAAAWLTPGAPLEADAMTASAFLGFDAMQAALATAHRHGKGMFVLAATSNPEAEALQTALVQRHGQADRTVAAAVVNRVLDWNALHAAGPLGDLGVVLGATIDFLDFGIDLEALAEAPGTPVLAPGFGAQGARFEDLHALFGAAAEVTIVSASRSILRAGPAGLARAIDDHRALLAGVEAR